MVTEVVVVEKFVVTYHCRDDGACSGSGEGGGDYGMPSWQW
jgi:hypothetical protein